MPTDSLVTTSFFGESINSIAAGICAIWEADVDTPAVYAEQCRVQSVDFGLSVMARLESRQFAGIGVMCRRGENGFVLDFGIVPGLRGQRLGHDLFAELMKRAVQAGLTQIGLVVNADNFAAQRIYQAAGFRHTRMLVSLRRNCSDLGGGSVGETQSAIAAKVDGWWRAGMDPANMPYWERDLPSLLAMADTRAFESDGGFLLVRRSPYHRQLDAVQLVLAPSADAHDLKQLLYAASRAYDHRFPIALPEEPLDSPIAQRLEGLGFKSIERSYEMQWGG